MDDAEEKRLQRIEAQRLMRVEMELLRAKQEREQDDDDDDEVDSDSEVGGEQNIENKGEGEGEGEGGDGKCNIVTNSRSRETVVYFIRINEIRIKTIILPQNYR